MGGSAVETLLPLNWCCWSTPLKEEESMPPVMSEPLVLLTEGDMDNPPPPNPLTIIFVDDGV